jgi:hypothetical protein
VQELLKHFHRTINSCESHPDGPIFNRFISYFKWLLVIQALSTLRSVPVVINLPGFVIDTVIRKMQRCAG